MYCSECGTSPGIVDAKDGVTVCDSCFFMNYDSCRSCSEWFRHDDIVRVRIDLREKKSLHLYDYRNVCSFCFKNKTYEAMFGIMGAR